MPKRKTSSTSSKSTESKTREVNKILPKKVRLKCKNIKQKDYAKLIKEKEITICAGPAGVGKSFLAIAVALDLIQDTTTTFEKILIIKPAVESEENLGFLPGSIQEKMAPYMASSLDIVDKIIGKLKRVSLEESGLLIIEPLGFIRGKSFDKSVLIMEEAQNISPFQMKTLLTRIGYNSKYIISGDIDQSDKYQNSKLSGLYDAMNRHTNLTEIGFFEFDVNDIVRNPLITKILNNYKELDDSE